MAHIHTQPGQHDLTASAIVIRTDGTEPVVLLHWHRKINKWMPFGGHVELDENPWRTIVRELREESGYELSQLKLLQPNIKLPELNDVIVHPWPVRFLTVEVEYTRRPNHYHTDICYAFTAIEAPAHQIDEGESKDYKLLARGQVAALTNDETPANIRQLVLTILDDYLASWKQVKPIPV